MNAKMALLAASAALALSAPSAASATVTFSGSYLEAAVAQVSNLGSNGDTQSQNVDGDVYTSHVYTDSHKVGGHVVGDTVNFSSEVSDVLNPTGGSYEFIQDNQASNTDIHNNLYSLSSGQFSVSFNVSNSFDLSWDYSSLGSSFVVPVSVGPGGFFYSRAGSFSTTLIDLSTSSAIGAVLNSAPNSTGSMLWTGLAAGNYKLLTVNDFTNGTAAALFSTTGSASGDVDALFNFDITEVRPPPPGVPEPGTWAMLMVGLFGVGGLLRARPRARAVAA